MFSGSNKDAWNNLSRLPAVSNYLAAAYVNDKKIAMQNGRRGLVEMCGVKARKHS